MIEVSPSPGRKGGTFCERFFDVLARGRPLVNLEHALNRSRPEWVVE